MQNLPDATAIRRQPAYAIAAVCTVFAVAVWCYWPSLSGPFLFDDIPNLELLGERGELSSIGAYLEFITSAQSSPLGRPLSLASFTLNGQTWPTSALPFRVTNLIIHLVNGLLILLLARSLLERFHDKDAALKLGLVCMALWVLHPLLVSTTAYIIQRMTQLASLFTLIGLLCYVHGRKHLAETPRRGWSWIVGGMGISGALAVLSKETGILLPLYALVIELTAFGPEALDRRRRRALILLLCTPLLVMLGYWYASWDAFQTGFEFRPYSMPERLLTQSVVVVEYLRQLVAPELSGLGIIHDDFPISRGLMSPPSTLISLVGLLVLLVLAIRLRRRWPIASLGVLWFLAGHSLEAGPMPLELYYNHRNYLPIFGPLLALCSMLVLLPGKIRRFAPVGIVVFLCLETFLTWQSAKMWSSEDLMMQIASVDHPDSLRARQYWANRYVYSGDYEQALETQLSIANGFPQHTSTRLSILNLRCLLAELAPEQVDATQSFLESSRHDQQIIGFLGPLSANAANGTCRAFGPAEFQATLDAMLRNPVIGSSPEMRGAAHYFKGIAYEREGRLDEAVAQLDLSYAAAPEMDIRLQQAVWLLSKGRVDDAERYLDLAEQFRSERPWRKGLRATDIEVLKQQIDQARHLLREQQDSIP